MKCTKDYIRSKFTKDTIYWIIPWSIFVISLFLLLFINVIIRRYLFNEINVIKLFWGSLFCFGLPILYVNIIKIRYFIIGENELKYYSFWHPLGKILYFSDFKGKIITHESGSAGSYNVIYFINKHDRTAFKLMGLHYKNFDEINNAIPLKKISFTPSAGEYFRLLFFERITIKKGGTKNTEEKQDIGKLLKIIQIIGIIGIVVFIVGSIVKILLK